MNSVPKSRDIKEVEDTVANSAKLINNLNNIVAGVKVFVVSFFYWNVVRAVIWSKVLLCYREKSLKCTVH